MAFPTYPNFAATIEPAKIAPFFDAFTKVGNVYSHSLQLNMGELWMSSARIMQEHTMRALMNASQECMAALAQNAGDIQQRSIARLGTANQKAMEIVNEAVTGAMSSAVQPPAIEMSPE